MLENKHRGLVKSPFSWFPGFLIKISENSRRLVDEFPYPLFPYPLFFDFQFDLHLKKVYNHPTYNVLDREQALENGAESWVKW